MFELGNSRSYVFNLQLQMALTTQLEKTTKGPIKGKKAGVVTSECRIYRIEVVTVEVGRNCTHEKAIKGGAAQNNKNKGAPKADKNKKKK